MPCAGQEHHHHPQQLLPPSPPLPGKAATLAPRAQAPMHMLTSGRLHRATSCDPLLPSPLPHGVCPLLAHILTQQSRGQFTDDQKHEMYFKVLQCHPVEKKRERHGVYSSGPEQGLERSCPSPQPHTTPCCTAELALDAGEQTWLVQHDDPMTPVHWGRYPPPQPVAGSSGSVPVLLIVVIRLNWGIHNYPIKIQMFNNNGQVDSQLLIDKILSLYLLTLGLKAYYLNWSMLSLLICKVEIIVFSGLLSSVTTSKERGVTAVWKGCRMGEEEPWE